MSEVVNASYSRRKYSGWLGLLAAVLLLPMLTGCDALAKMQEEKSDDPDEKFDFIARNDSEEYKKPDPVKPEAVVSDPDKKPDDKQPARKDMAAKLSTKRVHHTGGQPLTGEKALPGARQSRYYEDFILLDADEKIKVSMSFASAPIQDVLAAFADVLEFNFTADSALRTTVTLNVNSTLTRRELWETFDRMLQTGNAAAFKDGQLLRIVTANRLSRQDDLRINSDGTGNSEIIFYPLRFITAREALNQMRAFLTPSGNIAEGTRPNMLLLCDSSDNIPKLRKIIEIIDHPGRKVWPRAVIPCDHVLPSKIAAELSEILPVIGFNVSTAHTRGETPGSVYVTGVDRMQILVTSAATQEVVDLVKEWVQLLDSSDNAEEERVYVYKVANSKASQLAQALSVVFTTQGSTLTVDTSSGNNRTQQLTTQTTRISNPGNTGSASFARAGTNNDLNTTTTLSSNIFTTPVRIFADGIYNRLVIRTTPRVYKMMKALLDRLDTVPSQVLLQVLIVEVTLSDGNEFGVEFNMVGSGGNTMTGFGTNYNQMDPQGKDTGGHFYIANPNDPEEKFAYIRALASKNKVKIISSPQLLVNSNTEAKIQIGDEVPLVKGSVTNAESAGSVTNTYDYRETGIIMTMTPQVTNSDLISVEIKQEVSQPVTNTISTATDTPVIQKREIETSMTIANGKTMIMGGMIQEKLSDDVSTIPIIGDIPFLGRLFGNTNQSVKRTEMLVLVTGYIVDEKGKVQDMIKRYNDAVKELSKFEGNIADIHADDMEREARIRREKEVEAAKDAARKNAGKAQK